MIDITDFDPNGTGTDNGNYFGFPFTPEESRLVLVSVPWDVTASYGGGSAFAPDAIIGASTQLDFYDIHAPNMWRHGIGTAPIDYSIQERSAMLRDDALKVMRHLEKGGRPTDDSIRRRVERVNSASDELNEKIYGETGKWLRDGKLVGLVGGDHSTPLGFIRAVAEHHGTIGILHVDAHHDLRVAYEGFSCSHASIMYNVLEQVVGVEKLVQVGVRDFCDSEAALAAEASRIETFYDASLAENGYKGMTWAEQCAIIVSRLPHMVYISFDIDGLSPDNCPHTGTPVPGGLSFNRAMYLMNEVVRSGRRIVGFDMVEVAPGKSDEWDANVGARILYKLCNLSIKSNL